MAWSDADSSRIHRWPTVHGQFWVNAPEQVFVASRGTAELTLTTTILSQTQVRDLVERILKFSGRCLDRSSPFVDATLPGGERLHVVISDVTREHWAINIRKFVVRASHLDDLVALKSQSPQPVSGATQAGNPTSCEYIRIGPGRDLPDPDGLAKRCSP